MHLDVQDLRWALKSMRLGDAGASVPHEAIFINAVHGLIAVVDAEAEAVVAAVAAAAREGEGEGVRDGVETKRAKTVSSAVLAGEAAEATTAMETGTGTGLGAGMDAGTATVAETGAGTGTATRAGVGAGAGAGAGTGTGTGTGAGAATAIAAGTGRGAAREREALQYLRCVVQEITLQALEPWKRDACAPLTTPAGEWVRLLGDIDGTLAGRALADRGVRSDGAVVLPPPAHPQSGRPLPAYAAPPAPPRATPRAQTLSACRWSPSQCVTVNGRLGTVEEVLRLSPWAAPSPTCPLPLGLSLTHAPPPPILRPLPHPQAPSPWASPPPSPWPLPHPRPSDRSCPTPPPCTCTSSGTGVSTAPTSPSPAWRTWRGRWCGGGRPWAWAVKSWWVRLSCRACGACWGLPPAILTPPPHLFILTV